jgi:hypothetical protein
VQALDLVPKLTDEVMKKIEDIMENKPAPVVSFPFDDALITRKHLAEMRKVTRGCRKHDWQNRVRQYHFIQQCYNLL